MNTYGNDLVIEKALDLSEIVESGLIDLLAGIGDRGFGRCGRIGGDLGGGGGGGGALAKVERHFGQEL